MDKHQRNTSIEEDCTPQEFTAVFIKTEVSASDGEEAGEFVQSSYSEQVNPFIDTPIKQEPNDVEEWPQHEYGFVEVGRGTVQRPEANKGTDVDPLILSHATPTERPMKHEQGLHPAANSTVPQPGTHGGRVPSTVDGSVKLPTGLQVKIRENTSHDNGQGEIQELATLPSRGACQSEIILPDNVGSREQTKVKTGRGIYGSVKLPTGLQAKIQGTSHDGEQGEVQGHDPLPSRGACESEVILPDSDGSREQTEVKTGRGDFLFVTCKMKCPVCKNLITRKRIHPGGEQYACSTCSAKFTQHLARDGEPVQEAVKRFACDMCSSRFHWKSHLAIHIRKHSGEKPHACDMCDMRFSQHTSLVTHKRSHTGERPFPCDVCGSRFTTHPNLMSHMRVHTGDKPYACDACTAKFTTHSNLTAHRRIHLGQKPYACDDCDARFVRSSHLKVHRRSHTGEKPYVCDACDARFAQNSHLTIHKRSHTGEKPFACDLCQARFSSHSDRNKHKKLHKANKAL